MQTDEKNLQNIKEFYNEFSKKQIVTGVNLRHYYLFRQIVCCGLKKNHSLLEIGCGIATLTGLIANYLKRGKILATDISPENIELAKARLGNHRNIEFLVSDMQDFSYNQKFDFIVLADVLEHIPKNLHPGLFHVIAEYMNEDAILFINIPHPKNIEFIRNNFPERLQIIDQELYADELSENAMNAGLILETFHSYNLFHHENDYVRMIFRKNSGRTYTPNSRWKIILQKFLNRIYYWYSMV